MARENGTSFHIVTVIAPVIGSTATNHAAPTANGIGTPTPTRRRATRASSDAVAITWTRVTAAGSSHTTEISHKDAVWVIGCEDTNSKVSAWFHWSMESLLMIAGAHPAHHTSRGRTLSDPSRVARVSAGGDP